jgi:WD40 repeat protein/serine/threonine protein kinase
MKPCPSPERLADLLADRLAGADADAVEAHVEACAACRQVLERLTRAARARKPATSEPGESFLHRLLLQPPPTLGDGGDTAGPPPAGGEGAPLPPGPLSVPGYEILGELGKGGLGVVYKARQVRLDRLVAVKVVEPGRLADPGAVRRFHQEAKAAARMHHPNVVAVYDSVEAGGRVFLVMEYVEGTDLQRRVDDHGPLPVAGACACVRQVALALQHAHERGLVHRDVKPSNLMVDGGGTVKLLDLGLARLLPTAADPRTVDALTQERVVMGTPDFMAPEQALDARSADGRADLYSLGCTFYFLLTGQLPFADRSIARKLAGHQRGTPPPVEQLRPGVPAAVAAVVRRLMAREPEDRYQTAADLVAALDRAAAGPKSSAVRSPRRGPIKQSPPTRSDSPRRRWRLPLAAAAVAAVALVAVVAAFALLPRGGPQPPATAPDRGGGERAESRPDWVPAEVEKILGEVGERHWGKAYRLAVSPDGRLVASVAELDGIRLWDAVTLAGRGRLTEEGLPQQRCLAFSPDGRLLASGGTDARVRLWDVASGERARVFDEGHDNYVNAVAFAPDGRRLVSGSEDGSLRVWDVETGKSRLKFGGHPERIDAVAWSPGGGRILSCGDQVRVWDAATGESLGTLGERDTGFRTLAFAGEDVALAGAEDATVHRWDVKKFKEFGPAFPKLSGPVFALGLLPGGGRVAVGTNGKPGAVWDVSTGKEVVRLEGEAGNFSDLAFSIDGKRLFGCAGECALRCWDAGTGKEVRPTRGHAAPVEVVAFALDGGRLVSGADDGTARLWELASGRELHRLDTPHEVGFAFFSPDGGRVLTACPCGVMRLWETAGGKQVREWARAGEDADLLAVRLTADGKRVVGGTHAGALLAWDADSGKELTRARAEGIGQGEEVHGMGLSPDGATAAVAFSRGEKWGVRLVRVADGKTLRPLESEGDLAFGVLAFAPDGGRVAGGALDGTVRVWSAEDGARVGEWQEEVNVLGLAWSADGKRLAWGDKYGHVAVRDVAAGTTTRWALPGMVQGVAFSPDGGRLATANGNGSVFVFRVP